MGQIAIILNPATLENPDLDLRYDIPKAIEEITNGKIESYGYDYLGENDLMAIFLKTETPKADMATVCEILKTNTFCDNQVYDVAALYYSEKSDEEINDSEELTCFEKFDK